MNILLIVIYIFVLSFLFFHSTKQNNKYIETFLEFIHIPKNAGTTIENIADDEGIKWGRFNTQHKKHINNDKCTYWHIPPQYFNDNSLYNGDETFCVLRDPFKRIISEYAYRHKENDELNNKEDMNIWIKKNLNKENIEKGGMNCHFIPQSEYVSDKVGNVYCDNILPFDNLEKSFNNLMSKHDINLILTSNRKDNSTNFSLSVDDIDEANTKKIFDVYKKDFELIKKI